MKFSELWLREWVNPAVNSDELTRQLTQAGLEVDSVEAVAGDFDAVVVGHIRECHQHPSADKLRVTKIDIAGERLLNIVCGAPNCREGLNVAVALPGARLPGNIKIKVAKLRGEPSEGMLCSFSELGIAGYQDGIIELPADAPLGADIRDFLRLDDKTIGISVTPNRADCLSIIGIARDIAALNQITFVEPDLTAVAVTIDQRCPIRVDVPQACPRYLSRIVKNINMKAVTPVWMQEKLRRCGLRSIDPVVDITNFVLLELGQPMHAYDLECIDEEITVRLARADEELTLLNGTLVKLSQDVLVIADTKKIVAMAGICGGEQAAVSQATRNVLLECAFFNPLAIAGRARRHALHTEASHRYERGVDPQLQYRALERATALLTEICGGEVGPVVDVAVAAELPKCATITLRREKLDSLLGHVIPERQVGDILRSLGALVTKQGNQWQVTAPVWRFDMVIEEDLIEEIARIYGYNNIPSRPLSAELTIIRHPEAELSLKRVKFLLADRGYQEAITYSFIDPELQALLYPEEKPLTLTNPVSADMSAMRLSLLPGLLSAVIYNQNRQQNRIRLFESGQCFTPGNSPEQDIRQDIMLAAVMTGARHEEHWDMASVSCDFYDLKGDVEAILQLTGKLSDVAFRAHAHPALHPGQSAAIYWCGERIGFIGVLHPELEGKLGLNGRTTVFEVQWDKISARRLPEVNDVSRFPANRRDIAIVVAENIAADDIVAECKKVGENQLVDVNLFDVYRGTGITEGYKSLAISLILQDTTRTLGEEETAATVAKCVEALKQRFQGSLRD